jgi:nucleotide-binding universal stress UspA family protein
MRVMSTSEASASPAGAGSADSGRPVILVGIDESPASRAAMRWAVEHACATRAQIQAVAVWHLPPQLGDMPVLPCEQLQEEAQSWLREAIPPNCEVPVRTEVVRGDPTAVLLEHAQRAQLIVLGNHGHGPLHSAIFGSVVYRCAHRARCPVVLVPRPD